MCVAIVLDEGEYLSVDEVIKMNRANADGVGVAWVENGLVKWYKTTHVNPEYIAKMIWHHRDTPRLAHFRLSTVGGVNPYLCHPFEVGPMASANPVGSSFKVMIHNGHWGRWTDVADILKKEDLLPDKGPWSDTRLAAYLAHESEDWLEVMGGRVCTMDGNGKRTFYGAWEKLREGVYVSNKHWDHNYSYTRSGKDRSWRGWGWEEEAWTEWEKHEQEKIEKADAEHKAAIEESAKAAENSGVSFVRVTPDDAPRDGGGGDATGASSNNAPVHQSSGQGTRHSGSHNHGAAHGSNGKGNGAMGSRNSATQQSSSGSSGQSRYSGGSTQGNRKVDRKPFYAQATGVWYQADERGIIHPIEEDDALAALEQIAASLAAGGDEG